MGTDNSIPESQQLLEFRDGGVCPHSSDLHSRTLQNIVILLRIPLKSEPLLRLLPENELTLAHRPAANQRRHRPLR